jgi:hypothetical protein
MAELETEPTKCCSTETLANCCEPEVKDECCGQRTGGGCACLDKPE